MPRGRKHGEAINPVPRRYIETWPKLGLLKRKCCGWGCGGMYTEVECLFIYEVVHLQNGKARLHNGKPLYIFCKRCYHELFRL